MAGEPFALSGTKRDCAGHAGNNVTRNWRMSSRPANHCGSGGIERVASSASRALNAARSPLSQVSTVLTGPTDTDLTRGFDIPKASPESVAQAIFDGVEKGEEDIFPDPASQSIAEGWRTGVVKAMEHQFAAFAPAGATNAA
jgi:hypothetical protein